MGAWVLCIAFIGYACRMYICALNLFLHIQLYFGIMSKTFLSMAVFNLISHQTPSYPGSLSKAVDCGFIPTFLALSHPAILSLCHYLPHSSPTRMPPLIR